MTSGGTESILTAVKACRDYMAATRGITHPEMVVAGRWVGGWVAWRDYMPATRAITHPEMVVAGGCRGARWGRWAGA